MKGTTVVDSYLRIATICVVFLSLPLLVVRETIAGRGAAVVGRAARIADALAPVVVVDAHARQRALQTVHRAELAHLLTVRADVAALAPMVGVDAVVEIIVIGRLIVGH